MFQVFICIVYIFIHIFVFRDFDGTDIDFAGDGVGDKANFKVIKKINLFL